MFSDYGFASGYPKPCTFGENMPRSYTQDYHGVHPSVLGCWYAPACNFEVNLWTWQQNEMIRTQEVCDASQLPDNPVYRTCPT
jgi:hypothetical protein